MESCHVEWVYDNDQVLVNILCPSISLLLYVVVFVLLLVFVISFPSTGDGEVYVWDMNTRRCVHKFRDEGCLKSTTLSASKDGQYLACGWVSLKCFPLVHGHVPCVQLVGDGKLSSNG